jgi:hypothetical protein
MPPALITPILISAAIGAVTAAVTGGNILKGALFGAVGGAIGGAFLGAGAAGGTGAATAAEGALGGSAMGAATEPVTSLAMSGVGEGAAATMGAATEPVSSAFEFGNAASNASNVAAPTVSQVSGTGLSQSGMNGALSEPVASMGISEPVQSTLATTGDSALFNGAKDSQLANTQLGIEPSMAVKQPSTIESMWERVFGKDGMMEKPMFKGLAGSALQGYASGANQQKLLDERKAEIDRNRANAKFGTQTSRFAPVGLVATAKTPYKG